MAHDMTPGRIASLQMFLAAAREFADWRFVIVLALLIAVTLAEGFGLLTLLPLLPAVGVESTAPAGGLSTRIPSLLQNAGIPASLPVLLGLFLGFAVLQTGARAVFSVLNVRLQADFTIFLRLRFYEALSHAGWLGIQRHRASALGHALTTDLPAAGVGLSIALQALASSAVAAIQAVVAFAISPSVTLLALAGGALVAILRLGLGRSAHRHATAGQAHRHRLAAAVSDHLAGMKVAKSHGREAQHSADFEQHARAVAGYQTRAVRAQAASRAVLDLTSAAAFCGFAFYASGIAHVRGAELVLLGVVFLRTMQRLASIQVSWQQIVQMLPAFVSAESLRRALAAEAEPRPAGLPPLPLERELRFEGVGFCYDPASPPALADLDFTLPAGEMLNVRGASGAGKTTLADLLLGLLPPSEGRILVDGEPITGDRLHRWRQSVGYVPQESFLFHDTLRANLLWAWPEATETDLAAALRAAAAEDFVARLPQGLDTAVGDRGGRLSGGERQRIALARALLRRPALLVLDEATSALDHENEQIVLNALEGLRGRVTIVSITHRPAPGRAETPALVLASGRIVP